MKKQIALLCAVASLVAPAALAQSVDTVISSGLAEPYAVAVDGTNVYYLTDSANNRILKFIPDTGALTNLAGVAGPMGRGYVDGPGYQARFFNPQGLVAARGGLVVADAGNHLIRFVTWGGVVSTLAGDRQGLADGPGGQAKFNSPAGLAADAAGNVFVADLANDAVRLLNVADGVTTMADSFKRPAGLAVGGDGVIYVADSGTHSIRLIAPTYTAVVTNVITFTDAVNTNAPAAFPSVYSVALTSAATAGSVVFTNTAVNQAVFTNLAAANPVTFACAFTNVVVLTNDTGEAVCTNVFVNLTVFANNMMTNLVGIQADVSLLAGGGSSFLSGTNDSPLATEARFNNPRAVLWGGSTAGLLVSDSGNHLLRRVYWNPAVTNYSVETLAVSVTAGLVTPVGMAREGNGDLLVVDLGANTLRRILSTQAQLPVGDPQIGVVDLVEDRFGQLRTVLTPIQSATFNNDVVVAILSEPATETFYTRGTPDNEPPDPNSGNGSTPPPYENGLPNLPTPILNQSLPGAEPDVIIKAVSSAAGRRPSSVVSARFQFQVANPAIIGSNPGAVSLECSTASAVLRYTTDGSEPTQSSTAYRLGEKLNILNDTNDVVLRVRGFRNGYLPSRIVSQTFTYQGLRVSSIGIGRDFLAGIGATLIVPVEVNLNSEDTLRSLQFRVEIRPKDPGTPLVSDRLTALPIGNNDFIALTPPGSIKQTNQPSQVPYPVLGNQPLAIAYTNSQATGLEIGWFDTNYEFMVVGSAPVAVLAIPMPTNAVEGQTYSIAVMWPSGTSDGFETPVALSPMPDRTITVSNIAYVVGDSARSTWYNAGDFGNGNLLNNDVNNAFYASLGLRMPYQFSDVFDAMDAYPEDIAGTRGGDRQIRYLDWQVILDRALRLNTNNWKRCWSAGGVLTNFGGTLNTLLLLPAQDLADTSAPGAAWQSDATLSAGCVENAEPGQVVSVPVNLKVESGCEISGLGFLASVAADGDAPAITAPLEFTPASGKPRPTFVATLPASYGCGWVLGAFQPVLAGQNNLLGYLQFAVPANAQKGQCYVVRFFKADGSTRKADGCYARYDFESVPGSVWVQSPMLKAPDAISDEWRLHFFGSLTSLWAQALADPDGDGKNNVQEFLAGTDPAKLRFHVLVSDWQKKLNSFKLRWFAKAGQKYIVECAADPVNGPWQRVSDVLLGDGSPLELNAPRTDPKALFYRISVVQ
jgi:hypothetical protein